MSGLRTQKVGQSRTSHGENLLPLQLCLQPDRPARQSELPRRADLSAAR